MISKIQKHQISVLKLQNPRKKAIQVGEDRNGERRIREAKKESNN